MSAAAEQQALSHLGIVIVAAISGIAAELYCLSILSLLAFRSWLALLPSYKRLRILACLVSRIHVS